MGESFWQKNSLITHILFELWLIMICSPVANFVQQSLLLKVNQIARTFIKTPYLPYSKLSTIRPGRSKLLEFEKKIVCTGHLIESFSKCPDQVV